MPVHWSRKPGAAPYQASLDHGLWQVSIPHRASGCVELAYVRRAPDGRLPGVPLPIGLFSAVVEAILAVDVYEEGPAPGRAADLAAAHGFAGQGSDLVLVLADGISCVLRIDPDAVSLRILGDATTCVGLLHRPRLHGGFVAFERPPGIEDPEAIDVAVLLEILDLRGLRDPADVHAPMTTEELGEWRRARHPACGSRSEVP